VGRTLPALASNTSIVFGDKAILKLLRRPFTGHHPDLEVPAALSRSGSRLVAPPLGWIEIAAAGQGMPVHQTSADPAAADPTSADPTLADPTPADPAPADPTVLAILSVYFAHSTDAWTLATASLQAAGPDFSGESRQLGEATARLHVEMAVAFGANMLPQPALADLVDAMSTELTRAIKVVPALREHEAAVRACYARLAEPGTEVAVQRIHGDYHLAQVLGTDGGWVVLDFEGEPSVPLASRRAFAPALRDVAGMLRSFDYAARHQALRHPGDQRLAQVASDWVRHCQDAFCTGYAELTGSDPRHSGPLLRAFTLQKAVYEAVYEARHRPDWLPIPLGAIAEATDDSRS
jgi:maltokinase